MKVASLFQHRSSVIAASIFGLVAMLMCLNTVWTNDTVAYTYFSPVFDESSTQPINSFVDVIMSQADHYVTTNGRFVVHTFVQSFCALLGKTAFAIANGLVWFLLILLALRLPRPPRPVVFDEYFDSITYYDDEGEHIVKLQSDPDTPMMGRQSWYVAALLWIVFLPLPMDPAFQINYVWSAALLCGWFLLFFNEKAHKNALGFLTLSALYSVICGSLHEGFSIPMAVGICYLLSSKRQAMTRAQLVMAIAFGVGTLLVCLAPGNFLRFGKLSASKESGFQLISLLNSFVQTGYVVWIPLLPMMITAGYTFRHGRESKRFRWMTTILEAAILTGLIICLVTGYFGRAAIPAGFFIILVEVMMWERRWIRLWLPIVLVVIASVMTGFKIYNQLSLNRISTLITEKYHQSESGIIYLDKDLILDNPEEAAIYRWVYVKRERLTDPAKPPVTIRPDVMRDPVFEKDTNMIVQLAPQAWLLYRSKTHPATFTIDKILLPGMLNKQMSPRTMRFEYGEDFVIDTIGAREVVIYQNRRPFMRSSVRMELPDKD